MSHTSATINVDYSTDAAFRTMGSQINALLTAMGLTQASDTGQINWTTVTRNATLYGTSGYEVWRLNDTAQSTTPCFLHVSYNTYSATDRVNISFDLCDGTNGAGTPTGAAKYAVLQILQINSSAGSLVLKGNWNATVGYLGMTTDNISGISSFYTGFSCERLRTALGGPSTRGFAVVTLNSNGANNCAYSTWTPGTFSSDTGNTIPVFWPWRSSGAASAGGTFVAGLTPLTGNGTHGPLEKTLGYCGCGVGDFADGDTFTISRWDGNSHTYMALPLVGQANGNGNAIEGNCRGAILWE